MPFHGMSTYPYPASQKYPDGAASLEYRLNWNDRFEAGEPVRSYRFNYQFLPSQPAEMDTPTLPTGTRR
jgi:hypothetical protein